MPGYTTNTYTTANITVDGSALTADESLVVRGHDGSAASDPTVAFGGMHGNDTLIGGAGADRLGGGLGADTIYGGAGEDRIRYWTAAELVGDHVTGTSTLWDGNSGSLAAGGDSSGADRIQLMGAGTYDFGVATGISYIDRVDVVSGVPGAASGGYTITLTQGMAASADGNSDGVYGDIHVVGYDNATTNGLNNATTTNITIDGSALDATQSLVVRGEDGSLATDPAQAFGGMQGNDIVFGGAGDDIIYAGAGDDSLTGNDGNDILVGGIGSDQMVGGNGMDTFVFEQGHTPVISAMNLAGPSLANGDTFSFANGFDAIGDFSSGDTIVIGSTNGLLNMAVPTDGLVADQSYYVVLGAFDDNSTSFTVGAVGDGNSTFDAAMVVYDGDAGAGVSQTAILLGGITSLSDLTLNAGSILHV